MRQQLEATAHNAEFHSRILSQMWQAVEVNRKKAGKILPVKPEIEMRLSAWMMARAAKLLRRLIKREFIIVKQENLNNNGTTRTENGAEAVQQ